MPQSTISPTLRRIVVKLGTNVLVRADGRIALGLLSGLVESVAALRERGIEVVLVSSGAIALGVERLALPARPRDLPSIQACAAVGQSRLMSLYDDAFATMRCRIAQVLLTEDDFRDPIRYANLRATLNAILALGVIPIVNENDTVSTLEIDQPIEKVLTQPIEKVLTQPIEKVLTQPIEKVLTQPDSTTSKRYFSDNDKLSALLVTHVEADLLVLLSDIDGLFDRDPADPAARLLTTVPAITDEVRSYAHGGNGRGRGGMASKLEAARIVTESGRPVVIANGRTPQLLERILDGHPVGTTFLPQPTQPAPVLTEPQPDPALTLATSARAASRLLAPLSNETRNGALEAIATALESSTESLLAANALDLAVAETLLASGELTQATFDRLRLNPAVLATMAAQVRAVAALPDPLNRLLQATELDHNLDLEKRSAPLGVLAVVFEARPDAVTQITALALKSGNAVLLKPGREVEHTAAALVALLRSTLAAQALPADSVILIPTRQQFHALLQHPNLIDMVIPRGTNQLVRAIQQSTRIPVLGHAEGICHIVVDTSADPELTLRVVADSRLDYPAACNSVETVLLLEPLADTLLPRLAHHLAALGVTLLADDATRAHLPGLAVGPVVSWATEHGNKTLALRLVPSLDAAIHHIHTYGSAHTEAILTQTPAHAEQFLAQVDAAGVFVNAGTRFADGFRYGFGAEVGVSTSKFHARGPVGLDGLTTTRYLLRGAGQLAADYRGPNARPFTHKPL